MKIPEEANTKAIAKDLDMIEKLREVAAVHIESYQQRITNLYHRQVKKPIL